MISETTVPRKKSPSIEEIQPLCWEIPSIPDELRFVHALRLPAHWIPILKSLAEVDRVPPLTSMYLALRALAPEISYIYPNAFSDDQDRRPQYWLVAEAQSETLNEERFVWAIRGWLHTCYENAAARAVSQQLQPSHLQWERIDLRKAPLNVVAGALPNLVARYLLKTRFEFGLSDKEGQRASYPMRFAPSSYGMDADLITWPPTALPEKQIDYGYSYYLKFRVGFYPGSQVPCIFCQPGIRRWASKPLASVGKNGKHYTDLAWGREKSVFAARNSASWLTQQPTETSLIRFGLKRYSELTWTGRLPQVLMNSNAGESLPDPFHLLSHPADFQPNILVVHDATMSEKHHVGAGIEEADRWEVFTQLSNAFPQQLIPLPPWSKTATFIREQPSFAAQSSRKNVLAEVRLRGIEAMPTPALVEICSPDADRWEQLLLEEVGAAGKDTQGRVEINAHDGSLATFTIMKRAFPVNLSAELPPEAGDSDDNLQGLTNQRVRSIEKAIPVAQMNAGVLLEMYNYQDLHSQERERKRDPKQAARWGLARTGRKLQCIQPESANPENYEERVRHGIRDLLRQMDYHWNPPYPGFKGTSLPQALDLLGFWQIRLKARRRGERSVTVPLVIHAPAHEYVSYVCVPGEYGPTWYPYSEVLLRVPSFTEGFLSQEGMRAFFRRALQDRGLSGAALLLLSEQNIRSVFPEIKDETALNRNGVLNPALGIGDLPCRIGRLRFSGHGTVPLVCPTHTFGRFSGLFHDPRIPSVFYSIQERPLSAQRPTGVRQRDNQTRLSWNPSTVEILLLNLQPNDSAEEWAWAVHRLRQESFHIDRSTLLPEPLYALSKVAEYVPQTVEKDE